MGLYEEEKQEDVQSDKYLTFLVDSQSYGILIKDVVEIISILPISKVPEFADYAKGIINLRGKVIPVIDVRLRFKMPEKAYDSRTCIIIASINNLEVGFIVDNVQEVVDIQFDQIEEAPKIANGYAHRFISGVGKLDGKMILLLDSQRLLSEDELSVLNQGQPVA